MQTLPTHWPETIVEQLNEWGRALGFSQIGVADVDLTHAQPGLLAWLDAGFHGGMDYMARHGTTRAQPAALVPGTVRVITARMNYLPTVRASAEAASHAHDHDLQGHEPYDNAAQNHSEPNDSQTNHSQTDHSQTNHSQTNHSDWRELAWADIHHSGRAYVSRYALGRDYHKVMRARLQRLADQLQAHIGPMGHRVFTDSAPVLEAELATASGQGWRGKHTLVLSRDAGSMFFLGEIFVDVALPLTPAVSEHCGQCTACMDVCPTQAIVAPYTLDARRCISYLTIEHEGVIDASLRSAMGNRIYGCDDCQLVCPWNKYAQPTTVPDFAVREALDAPSLLRLWSWDEATFLRLTEGSAIRRIGHARWLRNLATAMGNALAGPTVNASLARDLCAALRQRENHANEAVREHVQWALQQYHDA
jgi:epoxyqueuosine reductase